MDSEPKVRKGDHGKKKDQKEKGKTQTLGSKKHVRMMEALMEKKKKS